MEEKLDANQGGCACGCGGQTTIAPRSERSRGVLRGEARRFIRGHNRRKKDRYAVVELGYPTPCWVWKLARTHNGYGLVRHGTGSMKLAHRVEYEQRDGPIPDGLTLDHLCKERGCINPEYLEPVTLIENQRRGDGTKLRPTDFWTIRASTEKQGILAVRFGIS